MHSSNSSHMFKNAEKYCLMSTSHPNKSFVFSIFSRIIHFVLTMFKKAKRSDIFFNLFFRQSSLPGCFYTVLHLLSLYFSLRKQPTFGNAITGFPTKWCLRNDCRNSILMTCCYPDLGSGTDWSTNQKLNPDLDTDAS